MQEAAAFAAQNEAAYNQVAGETGLSASAWETLMAQVMSSIR